MFILRGVCDFKVEMFSSQLYILIGCSEGKSVLEVR